MKQLDLTVSAADGGERLDRFLSLRGGISRGEARRLLERGSVWIDRQRVKVASRPVRPGQQVLAVFEEAGRTTLTAALSPAQILFEDEWLLAVDKPPHMPAQATLGSDSGNLLTAASDYAGKPLGIVHRLDLETSGITVFGKTKEATSRLAAAFREGHAHKRYLAIAAGELPDEGVVELPISPDPAHKGSYVAHAGGAIPALTRYRILGRRGKLLAVACFPETGRTHQIRVHLRAIGAPILGDTRYGGVREPALLGIDHAPRVERVLLHARALRLPHPGTGAEFRVEAPIPDDVMGLLLLAGVGPDAPGL